jgi:hypothetical protein
MSELHFLSNAGRNDKEKQRFVLKYEPKHVAASAFPWMGEGTGEACPPVVWRGGESLEPSVSRPPDPHPRRGEGDLGRSGPATPATRIA